MDMMATVESLKPNLTKAEHKLSEYIFSDTNNVIHMSITNLAERCDVSGATIVRFARKLGYEGYNDFKVALAQEITQKGEIESIMITGAIEKNDSIETIAKKLYEINSNALQHTMSLMHYDEINKSALMIASAKKIHFIGIGHSSIMAQDAKYKFMRIGMDTDAYSDGHTMIMMCSIMDKNDVVFAISHSGNTSEIVKSLKIAKEAGAHTICVSSNKNSKVAEYADSMVTYVSTETQFQTGSVPTKIAQYFVLDLIYTEVVRSSISNGAVDKKIKTTKALEELFK